MKQSTHSYGLTCPKESVFVMLHLFAYTFRILNWWMHVQRLWRVFAEDTGCCGSFCNKQDLYSTNPGCCIIICHLSQTQISFIYDFSDFTAHVAVRLYKASTAVSLFMVY